MRNRSSCVIVFSLFMILPVLAANYYVDNISGNDSRSGTSPDSAWKSISKVNGTTFHSSDTINFRRGSSWTSTLNIGNSGTAQNPIVYQAYDTGAAPRISRSGVNWAHGIHITGNHILVQDFYLSNIHEAGVFIAAGSAYNIIRNNEMTACGTGLMCNGKYNLVTHNYAHDLTMIHDDSGGDDDYGAVAFWFNEGCNEVSYNLGVHCQAHSYDYGTDGGFVEVFNHGDSMRVHHNWAQGSDGFFELGASQTGSARDVIVAYNVLWDAPSGGFLCLHDNGTFTITITNFRFENNTVVQTTPGYRVFHCLTDHSVLRVRNNIFYSRIQIANSAPGIHTNNLYRMVGGVSIGYSLGSQELTGDPLFSDSASGDFHLLNGSPAINTGVDAGYTVDMDSVELPVGALPDMGAYEYVPQTGIEFAKRLHEGSGVIQCNPNPFNPVVHISITTSEMAQHAVPVRIYDMAGQMVASMQLSTGNHSVTGGSYSMTWNASGHPSGIYIAQAVVDGKIFSKRITLIK